MRSLAFLVTVLVMTGSFRAPAQPLATVHISASGGGAVISSGMIFEIGYGGGSNSVALFNDVVWTPAMVGQTVLEGPGSGFNYDAFLSLVTDGVNEFAYWRCILHPSSGGYEVLSLESHLFTTHPAGWNGIDLHGYSIGSIGLRVDALSLQSPGSNPGHNGNWTDYSCDAWVTFYAVPEPAVESLLLLGCFGGWLRSRWRARGA